MTVNVLPKSVVIIGAGAAGLFTARRLRQLGVESITLLEKEAVVGGKCSTYIDPENPQLMAERGAFVIAPNYGEVIDALNEKGIKTVRTLGARSDSVEMIERAAHANFLQRTKLGFQLLGEIYKFNKAVKQYRKCCHELKSLPPELEASFDEFSKKNGLNNVNVLLKPFVAGFGYGDMKDCPTYSILEYMGYMTLPFLIAQHYGFESCELRSIEGGFQYLMTRLSEDFNVITSANIHQVTRDNSGITIEYTNDSGASVPEKLQAEALVLAVSPKRWEHLLGRENLTPIERDCVDQLTYYRYPVVICRLKGLPPNYVYRPEMLNKEHFGHVAFVSTLDKRESPPEGRLCSAYINQLPHHNKGSNLNEGSLELRSVIEDLSSLPGVTGVTIVECKIWEDYFPSLPWRLRIDLEKQQYAPSTKTIYTGSYTLGCFEDVACIANRVTFVINNCFRVKQSSTTSFSEEIRRFYRVSTTLYQK